MLFALSIWPHLPTVARAFDPDANGCLLTGQCDTTAMRFPVLVKIFLRWRAVKRGVQYSTMSVAPQGHSTNAQLNIFELLRILPVELQRNTLAEHYGTSHPTCPEPSLKFAPGSRIVRLPGLHYSGERKKQSWLMKCNLNWKPKVWRCISWSFDRQLHTLTLNISYALSLLILSPWYSHYHLGFQNHWCHYIAITSIV